MIAAAGLQGPFPLVPCSYAVLSGDGAGARAVTAAGSDAGSAPSAVLLAPGCCMRINTGGPVPAGADAVVQVEDTKLLERSEDGKGEKTVEILVDPKPGLDIRSVLNGTGKSSLLLFTY